MKLTVLLFSAMVSCATCFAGEWGSYSERPQVEFLSGRNIRLLNDLIYTTAAGEIWVCPAGHEVDGASIPQVFWSIIGGPLDGDYRNASIIHDYACDTRKRSWKSTHRVFYEAMRCSGVEVGKAKLMYWAVYNFGPRWEIGPKFSGRKNKSRAPGIEDERPSQAEERREVLNIISPEEASAMLQYIEANNPSLEALENGFML